MKRRPKKLAVLRYELETFVCSGQYEKNVHHILETYLRTWTRPSSLPCG